MKLKLLLCLLTFVCLSLAATLHAQPAPEATVLPQKDEYQRTLRTYMGTLTEKDFAHGVTGTLGAQASSSDPEYIFRNYVFTLMNQPIVGSKRGYPSVNAPPRAFTLKTIENGTAVIEPPVWPETLTSFTQWNYPGNPFFNNRALKLRALVTAMVKLMMIDDYLERNPKVGRADWYAYEMVIVGAPYLAFKDELPADVRKAFEAGLKKYARRLISWGPKGDEANFDMAGSIGIWYLMKACDDPEFKKEAEGYARLLMADPKHFNPAGFWIERGGLDVGFGGMANYFAIGAAMTGDWPFAKDAVDRVYRLKTHLSFQEPDGKWTGPTHFNTRLGTPADNDQWAWDGARDFAASLITDEAVCLVKTPTADELKEATTNGYRATGFAAQLKENPVKSGDGSKDNPRVWMTDDEIAGNKWARRMWQTWDFPASVNPGYEFYPKNAWAHRQELVKSNSPMLKRPYDRDGSFIHEFGTAFYATKQAGFAALLHTGPVGFQTPDDNKAQFKGPLGFGGGQLSAFWTKSTGSVILGRRSGNTWDKTHDLIEAWRTWPQHGVSGATADGKFFTSTRILKPDVAAEVKGNNATVKVTGVIPPSVISIEKNLEGTIAYARTFKLDEKGVHVETTVKPDGKDKIAELYEVIPVFHRDAAIQKEDVVTKIEFQAGGNWVTPTEAYTEKVAAVRLSKFTGVVVITFDSPRRVKLAPEWKDTYLSGAICRNLLIDLLENENAKKVGYRIEAVK